jgi:Cof subfamily protein (haloacid dehalogenase superfamily)
MPVRLLALDLDGTLYRTDGTISPWDIDAVAHAQSLGITVTIATGRISRGALPAARTLKLTAPLVCAEGATIVDPVTGDALVRHSMRAHHVEYFDNSAETHDLHPFWFLHDEIHGEQRGVAHTEYVATWSPDVTLHTRLKQSSAWQRRDHVTMAVAIGTHDAVKAAQIDAEAQHRESMLAIRFPIDATRETWALLVRDASVDKSTGLLHVANQLGITSNEVAVVGDWVNDVPMFRWAGRSFVMGQSPEHVSVHATDQLLANSMVGGGVAEAVMQILKRQ